MTATDLAQFGLIDGIISEPEGGTQEQPKIAAVKLKDHIMSGYEKISKKRIDQLLQERSSRLLSFGVFEEDQNPNKKDILSRFLYKKPSGN